MKYVDEFRDPATAQRLIAEIRRRATRRHVIMEVCGGQTHNLLRFGIDDALRETIELIHGPGCPVCVTPAEDIDFAVELAQQPNVVVASFGDMLRVPGTRQSLNDVRAAGGNVRVVYSPMDAVSLARQHPQKDIVFFAVGFETTAPATALAALQAQQLGLQNFSLLVSHVRVLPAMEALICASENRVEGFLAAGHVCTITGFRSYEAFVQRFRVPVVVTGFEPIDLLEGIRDCVRLLEALDPTVTNQYARSVRRAGNEHALAMIEQVYEAANCPWRGFGVIHKGGFRLRKAFRQIDTRERFTKILTTNSQPGGNGRLPMISRGAPTECQAAEILSGRIRPSECPHFGEGCTPDKPLGAPMVSSEGACAAYFRYGVSRTGDKSAVTRGVTADE